jgi:hypothetical protein
MCAHMWRRMTAIAARQSTGETTPHPGYADSLRVGKWIEDVFGWIKTVAGSRKAKLRGLARVDWAFPAAAYDLVRLPKLVGAAT